MGNSDFDAFLCKRSRHKRKHKYRNKLNLGEVRPTCWLLLMTEMWKEAFSYTDHVFQECSAWHLVACWAWTSSISHCSLVAMDWWLSGHDTKHTCSFLRLLETRKDGVMTVVGCDISCLFFWLFFSSYENNSYITNLNICWEQLEARAFPTWMTMQVKKW